MKNSLATGQARPHDASITKLPVTQAAAAIKRISSDSVTQGMVPSSGVEKGPTRRGWEWGGSGVYVCIGQP